MSPSCESFFFQLITSLFFFFKTKDKKVKQRALEREMNTWLVEIHGGLNENAAIGLHI